MPEPKHRQCVHTEHCCRVHGCKYGDEYCPVYLGRKCQSHPCEDCGDIFDITVQPKLEDVPKIRCSEFKRRRDEAEELSSIILEDE